MNEYPEGRMIDVRFVPSRMQRIEVNFGHESTEG